MINLLIDAPLLACPTEELTDKPLNQQFIDFATALTDLSKFRRSLSSATIWREASLGSTLFKINAYPFRHAIAAIMKKLDPELGFQLEDISSLAIALLSKSNCINEFVELEDVAINNCEIANDSIPDRIASLREYACRTTEFALCHLGESDKIPDSVRMTSGIQNQKNPAIFRYSLDMTSYRDGSVCCPSIDRAVAIKWFCGSELTLRDIDPTLIWPRADDSSLLDALAILAANQGDITYNALLDFKNKNKIGGSFSHTCQKYGFLHETSKVRRLMGAVVDICSNRNLDRSHWLRKGAGPNEAQKTREGGGSAWRHDIDDEFHLHYWNDGRVIELANVVVHNDFAITS